MSVSVKGGPTPNGLFTASFAQNAEITATGATTGSLLASGATQTGDQFQVGATTGLFLAATPVPLFLTGQTVAHLAVADLNRDGKDDFVALRSGGKIEVHLGDGAGAFTAGPGGSPAGTWPVGAPPSSPARLAVGDWDGDGYPDVVVAYPGQIVLYRNDGTSNPGAFSTSVTTGVVAGASFTDLKLVDYDRDGALDVVATDGGNSRLHGRRNDRAGGFNATADTTSTAGVPRRLAVADVNGDGTPDVVFTEGGTKVVLATGDGAFFTIASTSTVSGANMVDVVTIDVDRDGYPDAVAVDETAQPNNRWRVFRSSAPTQSALSATTSGSTSPGAITQLQPHDVVTGDWNGDGTQDTAIVHANPAGMVAFVGDGTAGYPPSNTTGYSLTPGTAPDRIAAGDFNRDGSPDLVAASSTVNDVAFLFAAGGGFTGGGTGGFVGPAQNPWGLTPTPRSVTVADFDHDGALDFVVSARENALALWRNNGHGKFTKQPDVFLGDSPERIRSGDLNRDGLPDLVVSLGGGMDRLEVHLSAGGGTFAAPLSAFCLSASAPTAFDLGDLDHDGRLDAACVESGTATFQVFRGNGVGLASAQPADRYAVGAGPVDVKLADVNGDGVLDVVLLCRVARTIEVHLGAGDGTFGGALTTPLSLAVGAASALALGDIDRDGKLDAVVASADSNALELLRGSGGGTFTSQGTIGAAAGATRSTDVVLADTDKDGQLDIVASRGDLPGAITAFVCTGGFTFANGLSTPTAQGGLAVGVALGDLNRDGKLDAVAPCDVTKDVQVLVGQ